MSSDKLHDYLVRYNELSETIDHNPYTGNIINLTKEIERLTEILKEEKEAFNKFDNNLKSKKEELIALLKDLLGDQVDDVFIKNLYKVLYNINREKEEEEEEEIIDYNTNIPIRLGYFTYKPNGNTYVIKVCNNRSIGGRLLCCDTINKIIYYFNDIGEATAFFIHYIIIDQDKERYTYDYIQKKIEHASKYNTCFFYNCTNSFIDKYIWHQKSDSDNNNNIPMYTKLYTVNKC